MQRDMPEEPISRAPNRGARWFGTATQWHWISSALVLVGLLFFATTGITLNNAEYLERDTPIVTRHDDVLPAVLLAELNAAASTRARSVPTALLAWVHTRWGFTPAVKAFEIRPEEVYVDLKRPGVDAWLSIDRQTGAIQYESDDRGWIAYFNDLHRGRNAGPAWTMFITLFGFFCIVVSVTGLLLLRRRARAAWSVWPLVGLGMLIPALLVIVLVC